MVPDDKVRRTFHNGLRWLLAAAAQTAPARSRA